MTTTLLSLITECYQSLLPCVIFDDALSYSYEVVTYSEIFAVSSAIACALREILKNVLKDAVVPIVAVFAKLSPWILSAIISILSTPATYCPIDVSLHFSKVWETILFCEASVVIIDTSQLKNFLELPNLMTTCIKMLTQFVQYGIVIAILDKRCTLNTKDASFKCTASGACCFCSKRMKPRDIVGQSEDHFNSHAQLHPLIDSSSIAYILHTSGSTGVPKKVSVPHGCIAANIVDLQSRFGISTEDRVFNAAPLTFDPSIVEIFLSLSSGACLVVVPDVVKATPSLLSKVLIQRQKVTVLQITPSVFNQIPETTISTSLLGEFSFLRILAFGGEVCPSLKSLAKLKDKMNSTRMFNIYGITEVSCWATCHEIELPYLTTDATGGANNSILVTNNSNLDTINSTLVTVNSTLVPIGECLLDTSIELRDQMETDNGVEGTLWIGGGSRVCLVGEECELSSSSAWRNSGDIAFKDDMTGHVYIIGRIDRQIKRKGHRVNMDHVQQVVSSVVSMVSKCSVVSVPGKGHELVMIAAVVPIENSFNLEKLLKALNRILPSSHIPDKIVCIDSIPVNRHGKCDYVSLLTLLKCWKPIPKSTIACKMDKSKILDALVESSNTVLAGKGDISACERWLEHSLSELGATSFDIVRIINFLEDKIVDQIGTCVETAEWFEPLLTKPIAKVVDIIYNSLETELINVYGRKRQLSPSKSLESDNKNKTLKLETPLDGERCLKIYRRGIITYSGSSPVNQYLVLEPWKHQSLSLCKSWSVPTGKCVDSSPLVVVPTDSREPSVVFIGSHSGLVLAIKLDSGTVQWTTQLPDRLESSPCLSVGGCRIIIGCYDGCVYTLDSASGSVEWCFRTDGVSSGDPVKSSPVVHPSTGLVWFGSHDKHVYCIDIHKRRLVHKVYLDGGSCFSSPAVSVEQSSVYAGTLKGNMFSIDVDSGQIKWCFSSPKPVFSSPTVLADGSVAFGCVDGCVYIVGSSGQQIQILKTSEAIFSSCVSIGTLESSSSGSYLYAGSHDSHMYCWELISGKYQLKWKCKLDSSIYSTCMLKESKPLPGSYANNMSQPLQTGLMCVCSCKGVVCLIELQDGTVVSSIKLPGEVFSSPAIVDDRIVVGCRDELVYCLHID